MRDPGPRLRALARQFPVDWSRWYQGRDANQVARAVVASLLADHKAGDHIDRRVAASQLELVGRYQELLSADPRARGLLDELDALVADGTADRDRVRELVGRVINVVSFDSDQAQALHREALAAELWASQSFHAAYRECLAEWAAESGPGDVGPVRDELTEGIDAALRERFGQESRIGPLEPVSGGYSKLTLSTTLAGRRIVIRADRGTGFAGASVRDEFEVIRAAHAGGVPVPRPFDLFDPVAGRHDGFMTLEHRPGAPFGWVPEFRDRALCRRLATILAGIHAVDCSALIRVRGMTTPTHEVVGDDITRTVRSWRAAGCVNPVVDYAIHWLRQHQDWADGARTLVHGDYRPQNILREGDQITAVLDWEHAKIGNPVEDLAYVREAVESLWSWDEFLGAYVARGGSMPDERALTYYEVRAALFVIAILDQVEKGFAGDAGQPAFQIASVIENRAVKVERIACLMDLPVAAPPP